MFFYSGHGTQTDENLGMDDVESDGIDEAIIVHDSLILDDEIGWLLERLPAANVLAIFDSCFSGTGTRGVDNSVKGGRLEIFQVAAPKRYTLAGSEPRNDNSAYGIPLNPQHHVFLASSSEAELSWISDELGSSVFTYFLTSVLEDVWPDTSFDDVALEVSQRTRRYVLDRYQAYQTPQVEGVRSTESVRSFLGR